ncbi:hypothetical protein J2Y55_002902 [Bosea sp. BE125]|uniref:hypothetical protein n=1 Tax=Bosea sp. BE125 TaxID=2817909 RepID=UPI0028596906|nr:hypothetical protein [Bosea sp. BE125]MDR6871889.1 hypothetical protein [Bosea sp. BE125]
MRAYDVIPFGERQFLLNFWPVAGFLQQFSAGQYYAATCKIVLSDGHASLHDCIVRRIRKHNFANVLVDNVYILVKTDFSAEALSAAFYQMTHVGSEISETQALVWKSEP